MQNKEENLNTVVMMKVILQQLIYKAAFLSKKA